MFWMRLLHLFLLSDSKSNVDFTSKNPRGNFL